MIWCVMSILKQNMSTFHIPFGFNRLKGPQTFNMVIPSLSMMIIIWFPSRSISFITILIISQAIIGHTLYVIHDLAEQWVIGGTKESNNNENPIDTSECNTHYIFSFNGIYDDEKHTTQCNTHQSINRLSCEHYITRRRI